MSATLLSIVLMGNTLLPATFCDGTRLDKTMTYSQWLHAYALDLNAAAQYVDPELTFRRYLAYKQQSQYVKRGQVKKCGHESANWND